MKPQNDLLQPWLLQQGLSAEELALFDEVTFDGTHFYHYDDALMAYAQVADYRIVCKPGWLQARNRRHTWGKVLLLVAIVLVPLLSSVLKEYVHADVAKTVFNLFRGILLIYIVCLLWQLLKKWRTLPDEHYELSLLDHNGNTKIFACAYREAVLLQLQNWLKSGDFAPHAGNTTTAQPPPEPTKPDI